MPATKLLGPTVIFCAVILFGVMILSMVGSIEGDVSDPKVVNSGLDDSWGIFNNQDGTGVEVLLEIADTPEKQRVGLMNRLDLHNDQGMLFAFESERNGGFWMRNTLIYLDMIYLNKDKTVVDIIHQAQPCRTEECPVYAPDSPYQYVVEVNGGWAKENGVVEGSILEIEYEF